MVTTTQNKTKKIDWKEFENWLNEDPVHRKRESIEDWKNMLESLKKYEQYQELKDDLEILTELWGDSTYRVDSLHIEALEEWLKTKKIIADSERIIEKKNWENIHEGFVNGFEYRYVDESGVEHYSGNNIGYLNKNHWKQQWFNYEQTKAWIEAGLTPKQSSLAAYLRWKGIEPQKGLSFKQLEREWITWIRETKNAQDYLDYLYPPISREWIKGINFRNESLTGHLDLSEFRRLRTFKSNSNELYSLNVNPKLDHLRVHENLFDSDEIIGLEKTSLTKFSLYFYSSWNDPTTIWKLLVRQHQAIFPEMELINIEDLNKLAEEIPDYNATYEIKETFLQKFWSLKSSDLIKYQIKTAKSSYHYLVLKRLAKHIFLRCLTVRKLLHPKKKDSVIVAKSWEEYIEQVRDIKRFSFSQPYKKSKELTEKILFGEDTESIKLLQDLEYLNPKYKIPADKAYFNQWIDNLQQEGKIRRELEEKLKEKNEKLEEENEKLETALQIERKTFEEALQKAQEWRERQLKEITEQKDQEIKRLKKENANLQQQLSQQAQIEAGINY